MLMYSLSVKKEGHDRPFQLTNAVTAAMQV